MIKDREMFDFLKRKNQAAPEATNSQEKPSGFFSRLKQGLSKTRAKLTRGMANLFLGKKELDANLIEQIEMQLLTADVGVETTEQLIRSLTQKLARKELHDGEAAFQCLREEMKNILQPCEVPLIIPDETK